MRFIYLILVTFAAPVAAIVAWVRGVADPARRERLADRFGCSSLQFAKPVLWVHAASMGEVQAGASLVKRLLAAYPNHQLLMTTMTMTGAARVRTLFDGQVTHALLPYDLPFAVRGFLDRVKPQLALILETELWPNLLCECRARRIPVILASARISPRTANRYRRLAALFHDALQDVVIAAQTVEDVERFKNLGASNARVTGNLKFDIDIPDAIREAGKSLRTQFVQRFVWVAGSTHAGEEAIVLEAHQKLSAQRADALLILAPRHPQRFDEVGKLLERSGVAFVTRSSDSVITKATTVLLVDTMGELLGFYAAANAAFVGGSLVPIGGHNLLEPAALGVATLCGPYTANTQESADLLARGNALIKINSAEELAARLLELSMNELRCIDLGQRAERVVQENRGALNRVLALIAERIGV